MKIYEERALKDFEFWSGAKEWTKHITDEEFDRIEFEIEDWHIWSSTDINDLFWFEEDLICEIIGYKDFEDFYEKRILPPWE